MVASQLQAAFAQTENEVS
uniref:Uncharacterized protein n=1 Tax=Oryza punctata TaxID=4537 RepID=A0A0E0M5T5_ORYPU